MSLSDAAARAEGLAAGRKDLPPIPAETYCPDCGYDLRGLTAERCPECGFGLEVVRTREPQIPWCHRRELGWFRAYWRTVWLVGRYPRRFCTEMVRPVSYRDSQSFRWVTFLHAWVPLVAGSLLWYLAALVRGVGLGELERWVLWSVPVVIGLAFAVAPGLASYRFQDGRLSIEQQNRAIALSYYAHAPVALVPLGFVLLCLGLGIFRLTTVYHEPNCFVVGASMPVAGGAVCLGAGFFAATRFAQLTRHVLRPSGAAGSLRALWVFLLGLATILVIFALPLLAFYLLVIWHSLG